MTDATGNLPLTSGASQPELDLEYARIGAEISGLAGENDPFVAAVRATRMPMVVTDPRQADNPVVFANNAFCRLTGYDRAEIVGRNCRFLQGPETDPQARRRIHDAVAAAESIEIDIRNYRKDGTAFWNRLLLAPVRDAAGVLAYFFASQVDVTMELERLAGLESHNAALLAEVNGCAPRRIVRPGSVSPPRPGIWGFGNSIYGPRTSSPPRSIRTISALGGARLSLMRMSGRPCTRMTARVWQRPSNIV
jgi:PAS domain S-box-containing protein